VMPVDQATYELTKGGRESLHHPNSQIGISLPRRPKQMLMTLCQLRLELLGDSKRTTHWFMGCTELLESMLKKHAP
jgi:hypothetical protein